MAQERQPNGQDPVNRSRVPFPWEKQPGVNPTTPPTLEKPRLQSKKIPVQAQAIWKGLVHEERLNKRLGKGRKLISVLSQILDKKTSPAAVERYAMRAEEAARQAETSAGEAKDSDNSAEEAARQAETAETNAKAENAATRAETAKNEAEKALGDIEKAIEGERKRQRSFRERVKRHGLGALGTVLGTAGTAALIFVLNAGDGKPDQAIATPTSSAATGTPTPEPTNTPTLRPTEVVKTPNFGVRYDPNTGKCDAVDKGTGKAVDISNDVSTERTSYQETGIGVVKDISITLQPGQTAIIQGWKVDGKGNGVFKAITATEQTTRFSVNIADGAVEIVDSQNGPLVFCRAVQIAVDKGYAHEKVEIPEAWKIAQ